MSGMQSALAAIAQRDHITEDQAWQRREDEAFRRLADARADLDRITDAIAAGHLPRLAPQHLGETT